MDSTPSPETCWHLIQGAASGKDEDRERFGRRYADPLRAFFAARWRYSGVSQEVDDALQEVFLECFRSGGVLERVEEGRPGGFRAFLYGVARNVARRLESRRSKHDQGGSVADIDLDQVSDDDTPISTAFDRAWARSVMREAARVQQQQAHAEGADAVRRLDLLRLRFGEGLAVREIATRLGEEDRDAIHRDLRRAREGFKEALREVVSFDLPGATSGQVERECELLQELLN